MRVAWLPAMTIPAQLEVLARGLHTFSGHTHSHASTPVVDRVSTSHSSMRVGTLVFTGIPYNRAVAFELGIF